MVGSSFLFFKTEEQWCLPFQEETPPRRAPGSAGGGGRAGPESAAGEGAEGEGGERAVGRTLSEGGDNATARTTTTMRYTKCFM